MRLHLHEIQPTGTVQVARREETLYLFTDVHIVLVDQIVQIRRLFQPSARFVYAEVPAELNEHVEQPLLQLFLQHLQDHVAGQQDVKRAARVHVIAADVACNKEVQLLHHIDQHVKLVCHAGQVNEHVLLQKEHTALLVSVMLRYVERGAEARAKVAQEVLLRDEGVHGDGLDCRVDSVGDKRVGVVALHHSVVYLTVTRARHRLEQHDDRNEVLLLLQRNTHAGAAVFQVVQRQRLRGQVGPHAAHGDAELGEQRTTVSEGWRIRWEKVVYV